MDVIGNLHNVKLCVK